MRTDLTSLQNKFAEALIDANQEAPTLENFKGDPALNRERLAFYRGNINAIWQQSCESAYPVLRQLLGADFFNDLSRAYGHAHPSQSGNLAEFGAAMANFIGTVEHCQGYPYLSDIAALEWLVHRAYYLQHCAPITLAELTAVPPEQLGELRCQLQPCCALIQSPWAIEEIWHAHQGEQSIFPAIINWPSTCLVWRQPWQSSWKVHVNRISTGTYLALKALQEGEGLGSALEKAITEDPTFAVQAELAGWLQKQLITAITSSIKPN